MKLLLCYWSLAAAALGAGTGAAPGTSAGSGRFGLIGPDFKQSHEVPSTFFNPFKSQANVANLIRKETATISGESVIDAVEKKGISGVVLSADALANHVVMGDEVFGVGDELTFPAPHQATGAGLIAGASVFIRAIRAENLELELKVEGETVRRIVFPLQHFWAR